MNAENFLFIKHIECPCCNKTIEKRTIRTGKLKLKNKTLALRNIYEDINVNAYELIWCNNCGFATIDSLNKPLLNYQSTFIKENISKNYIPIKFKNNLTYTNEEMILGYKLVLYNSLCMKSKNIDKAYILYKYSFILDSLLELKDISKEDKIKILKEKELVYTQALKGFNLALEKETFNILTYETTLYITSYISLYLLKYSKTNEYSKEYLDNLFKNCLSKVVTSRQSSKNLKDYALRLKDFYNKK